MDISQRLSGRKIQPGSQKFGKPAHDKFLEVLAQYYPQATVVSEPRILQKLGFWASIPDFAVSLNGRTILIEIKRQGAQGNAHERLYKFYTPRFISEVSTALGSFEYPLYAVLCDELASNPRYIREIEQHLDPESYLLWEGYKPDLMVTFLDQVFAGTGTFVP